MGNAHVSRRGVVRAGEQAVEALMEQRNLFEVQKEMLEAAMKISKHTSDRVDGMAVDLDRIQFQVDTFRTALTAEGRSRLMFQDMDFWGRMKWLFTGQR